MSMKDISWSTIQVYRVIGPADIELYGLKKRGMSWERHKSKHGMEIVNHGQKSDKLRFYKAIIVTTRDSKSIW